MLTDATWNPVTGCTKVSQGGKDCCAERAWGGCGDVRFQEEALTQPFRWEEPRRVFVNRELDLFHADVPDYFIDEVFSVMALAHWHTFQLLTKQPERMRAYLTTKGPPARGGAWALPNVWFGVRVGDQATDAARDLLAEIERMGRRASCAKMGTQKSGDDGEQKS